VRPSDGASESLIHFSAIFLLPSLHGTRLPVVGHSLGGVHGDVFHDVVCIHMVTLSGSFFIIQWSTNKGPSYPMDERAMAGRGGTTDKTG